MDFSTLRDKYHKTKPNPQGYESILAFDPGHTTGWAHFQHGDLNEAHQIYTKSVPECVDNVRVLFEAFSPDIIVMEDYRIYAWKQKQHVGSDMLTTRIIGSIETLAHQHGIRPVLKQSASIGKGFCTDYKLKDWDYYLRGEKHARDAIRHGCYFILFGHKGVEKPGTNTTTMGA